MDQPATTPSSARQLSPTDFERVVRSCHEGMRRLAFGLVGDSADDVLQIAYVKAYRAYESFRGDAKFETWMYRIVYNACIDHRRGDLPTVQLYYDDLVSTEDIETGVVRRADLAAALGSLTVGQRAAVMLVDAEGFTFADAAAVLDLPVGTVASRVSRARTQLRRQIGDHS